MSTIQVDFTLPERFELEYAAADGSRQRPVMLHRALFGSIERFFAVLLEHYAGAFPAWLAPVQVVGIPVHSDYDGYLLEVAASCARTRIRVEVDTSDDRMQKKIRTRSGRRCRSCSSRRGRRHQGRRVVPLPRRDAGERRAGRRGVAKVVAAVESRT
jgi:threonyl-tRNA synthetase